MTKKLVTIIAAVAITLCALAEDGLNRVAIQTTEAGSLASRYAETLNDAAYLEVEGPINIADIDAIRKASVFGKLTNVDLSKTNIEGSVFPRKAFFADDQYLGDGYYRISNIQSIILPGNTRELGESAFAQCRQLEHIELPPSLKKISAGAFSNCDKLATNPLVIPEGVTEIPGNCFMYCGSLREVALPASIKAIGDYAFFMSGITECELPIGLEAIGTYAFADANLTTISIPENCRNIGDYCFCGNRNAASISIPEGITSIPRGLAEQCWNLEEIKLPSTTETIEADAFNDCQSLWSISLPEGLKRIESFALAHCSSLESITFPSTLEYLGKNSCASLAKIGEIRCKAIEPPICDKDAFSDAVGVTLFVPLGSADAYRSATGWDIFGTDSHIEESEDLSSINITANNRDDIIIESAANVIVFDNPIGQVIPYTIYTPDGKIAAAGTLPQGPSRINCAPGGYIAKAGASTKKLIIR